jgi:SpoVK/Ycf46/Vps4 family AAA+-type ATPase
MTKPEMSYIPDGYSSYCPRCCKRHGKAEYGARDLERAFCKDCAEKERKYRNEEQRMRDYYARRGYKG